LRVLKNRTVSTAVHDHGNDEKGIKIVDALRGTPHMFCAIESGLYALTL
jgi:hypothetical protein